MKGIVIQHLAPNRVMTSGVAFVGNMSTALSIILLHRNPAPVRSHAAHSLQVNTNEVKSFGRHGLYETARELLRHYGVEHLHVWFALCPCST